MELPILPTGSTSKQSDVMLIRSARYGRSVVSMKKDHKEEKGRVPHPSHRHASPSSPWPWIDLDDEVDVEQLECPLPPVPPLCDHVDCGGCWTGYPQSRFPHWTERQVKKSGILDAINNYSKDLPCICHRVDVDKNGMFTNPGPIVANHGEEAVTWNGLINEKRPDGSRLRALFLENASGPMLQMLGAKYDIDPTFWSSSLTWIPSRFQEDVKPGVDITFTLTFVRSVPNYNASVLDSPSARYNGGSPSGTEQVDPHSPLSLHSNNRLLVYDLLAVYLIRNINGSTIISFHPTLDLPTTTAAFLHERTRFAGQSMYWQNIFQKHSDPTFVLLTFLWHAMYAWDEALENLLEHISSLESGFLKMEGFSLTLELHTLLAHQFYYSSLLDDYSKHVLFIRDTHNPAMDSEIRDTREFSKLNMDRECTNLLMEISRLKGELQMQESRIKNVMKISDSYSRVLITQATVRDSTGKSLIMRQIAYLTMIFLPTSLVAGVFGMNVREINPGTMGTVGIFLAISLGLTLATMWIVIAFQSIYMDIFSENTSFVKRLGWPVRMLKLMVHKKRQAQRDADHDLTYSISTKEAAFMA